MRHNAVQLVRPILFKVGTEIECPNCEEWDTLEEIKCNLYRCRMCGSMFVDACVVTIDNKEKRNEKETKA